MEQRLPTSFIVIFYGVVAAFALICGRWLGDIDVMVWHNHNGTSIVWDAVLGALVGVVVVVGSQILDRTTQWARVLTDEFTRILGSLTVTQAFVFAFCSGVAEEIFFRGFLQQLLTVHVYEGSYAIWFGLIVSSLIFGGLHLGPDFRKFWPWTVMAVVLGAVFGGLYIYTGNLLAPILAHFTINFFNLLLMSPHEENVAHRLSDEE